MLEPSWGPTDLTHPSSSLLPSSCPEFWEGSPLEAAAAPLQRELSAMGLIDSEFTDQLPLASTVPPWRTLCFSEPMAARQQNGLTVTNKAPAINFPHSKKET